MPANDDGPVPDQTQQRAGGQNRTRKYSQLCLATHPTLLVDISESTRRHWWRCWHRLLAAERSHDARSEPGHLESRHRPRCQLTAHDATAQGRTCSSGAEADGEHGSPRRHDAPPATRRACDGVNESRENVSAVKNNWRGHKARGSKTSFSRYPPNSTHTEPSLTNAPRCRMLCAIEV